MGCPLFSEDCLQIGVEGVVPDLGGLVEEEYGFVDCDVEVDEQGVVHVDIRQRVADE